MATKDVDKRINWAELSPELMTSIMHRLDVIEILENVQKVCTSWRRVSKDPSMWRKIDMRNCAIRDKRLDMICRQVVDRSKGGLVEIKFDIFSKDQILNYVAHRSSNLRSLTLSIFNQTTNKGLVNAVSKLPLLEELEITPAWPKLNLNAIGHSCPRLKVLKLNCSGYKLPASEGDDYALAIAESMSELRYLQLFGDKLTDIGLNAILDNCPHIEHLDLRKCVNVGNLEKRCIERIKHLRRPNDSTNDYPLDFTLFEDDNYLLYLLIRGFVPI